MTPKQLDTQRALAKEMGRRNLGRPNINKKRPYEVLYNKLVREANYRFLDVSLTYDNFVSFTNEESCHYCGVDLVWTKHNKDHNIPLSHNLDRKNNDLGYSSYNCVACCKRCNWGKGDRFTYEEWVVMTKALREMKTCPN